MFKKPIATYRAMRRTYLQQQLRDINGHFSVLWQQANEIGWDDPGFAEQVRNVGYALWHPELERCAQELGISIAAARAIV